MLTSTMNAFKAAFESGITAIQPATLSLYGLLLTIDFVWAMCKAAMDPGANYLKIFVEKTLRYSIFYFLIANYSTVFHQIIDSLIEVGLMAGGGKFSASSFADPSWMITKGFSVVEPLDAYLKSTRDFTFAMFGGFLLVMVIYVFIILAFAIMAIQVFITYLEVYIVGTLAVFFLAFSVNKHTTFLAEKAIGALLSFGIKLMTLAFIISVGMPIMDAFLLPEKVTIEKYFIVLISYMAIAFLCWQAPSLAAGLMAGSPSLTAGGVAGAVMSGGAMAVGGAMLGQGIKNMAGALSGGAGLANATLAAANAAQTSASAGVGSSVLDTGGGGSAGGAAPAAKDAGDTGVTAAGVAQRLSPEATGGADSGSDYADQLSAHIANNDISGGDSASSGSTPTANASTGGEGNTKRDAGDTGVTAANVASKLALANSAIPSESSPQGGVGASIQVDDD